MKKKLRVLNVLVAGHSQHGKSTLIEAIVGKFPDNLDFELSHGTTVTLKVIQFLIKEKNYCLTS
jgi:translation initiation factor 2 gamma subunit (eIF-2gamma)